MKISNERGGTFIRHARVVTVCHFSDWIELDELKRANAANVIECTKAHFARFGVPQIK